MKSAYTKLVATCLLLVSFVGCVSESALEQTRQPAEDEIVILLPDHRPNKLGTSMKRPLEYAGRLYFGRTGTKVTFTTLSTQDASDASQALSFALLSEDAPEILLTDTNDQTLYQFVENEALLPIRDQLDNANALYPGLSSDTVIPIGIKIPSFTVNKKLLEERGLDVPSFDWTFEEYTTLSNQLFEDEPVHMTGMILYNIVSSDLYTQPIVDFSTGEVLLNPKVFEEMIRTLVDAFSSEQYIVNANLDETDYYHMLDYGRDHYTHQMYQKDRDKHLTARPNLSGYNLLNPVAFHVYLYNPDVDVLSYPFKKNTCTAVGVAVNRKSHNIDKAIDFIDFYLSDEIQFAIFTESTQSLRGLAKYSMVNRNIEDDMKAVYDEFVIHPEALEIVDRTYSDLRSGVYQIQWGTNKSQEPLRQEVLKVVFQLALTEDYKDPLKLEKAYNDLFNELQILVLE